MGMLKQFMVSNFKNFEKPLVLDLTAGRYTFNKENVCNGVVKNAIIYGYNACGKSNLALAIFDIVGSLTDNHVACEHYRNYQNVCNPEKPAEFSYTFEFDSDTLVYSYKKMDWQTTIEEQLEINGKTFLSFSRDTKKLYQSFVGAETLNSTMPMTILRR